MAGGTLGVFGTKNRLVTPTILANEALMRLDDALFIVKLLNREYQALFADKIGNEIHYKLPYYAVIGDGQTVAESDANPLIDRWKTLKVDTWKHAIFKFNSEELTHSISSLGDRYLGAGMQALAHSFDEAAGKVLGSVCFRINGTAGTTLTLAETQRVAAHADEVSIPQNMDRFALLEPYDLAAIGISLQGLSSQDRLVGVAIEDRFMARLAGFDLYMSTNIGRLVNAAPSGAQTPLVNKPKTGTSGQTGYVPPGYEGNSVPSDGWGNAAQKVLNKGQLIQFAGVYESTVVGERRSTGNLMTFTVTADVSCNASGLANIPIDPPANAGGLTTLDGAGTAISEKAFQNIMAIIADNAVVTILGAEGKTYRQSVWATKNVGTVANVMIVPPPAAVAAGLAGTAMDPDTGLAVSVVRDFKWTDLSELHRMDSKWGVDGCYPDQGIRVLSDVVSG